MENVALVPAAMPVYFSRNESMYAKETKEKDWIMMVVTAQIDSNNNAIAIFSKNFFAHQCLTKLVHAGLFSTACKSQLKLVEKH